MLDVLKQCVTWEAEGTTRTYDVWTEVAGDGRPIQLLDAAENPSIHGRLHKIDKEDVINGSYTAYLRDGGSRTSLLGERCAVQGVHGEGGGGGGIQGLQADPLSAGRAALSTRALVFTELCSPLQKVLM